MADLEAGVLEDISDGHQRNEIRISPDDLAKHVNIDKKLLNIVHLNIGDIKTNFDKLLIFLQAYNLLYCDVIVLGECHRLFSVDMFHLPGYDVYYNSADFNSFDGLVIYTKCNLNPIFTDFKLNVSKVTITKLSLSIAGTKYHIHTLYRSPSCVLADFMNDLDNYFNQTQDSHIDVFVGDININCVKV